MGTQDTGKKCQGTRCTVVDGKGEHSRECRIEYARSSAGEFPTKWKHLESGRIVTDVKEGHVRIYETEWVLAVSYTVETGVQYTRDKDTFLKKFTPVHEATCPTCGAGPDDTFYYRLNGILKSFTSEERVGTTCVEVTVDWLLETAGILPGVQVIARQPDGTEMDFTEFATIVFDHDNVPDLITRGKS